MAKKQNQNNQQKKLKLKAAKRKKHLLEAKKKSLIRLQNELIDNEVGFALELIQENSFFQAEKILNGLLKRHPNNGYIYYGYGLLYLSSHHEKLGIAALEKAIILDPKFAASHLNLALAYFKGGLFHKMVRAIDKMHEDSSYDEECYSRADQLLIESNDVIQKIENISLEQMCKNLDTFDEACSLMESRVFPEAIELFLSLIKTNPKQVACHGNLGICYASIGQRSLAIEHFDQALSIDPNYELATVNKALTEQLNEGEKLDYKIVNTEYYKEYPMKNKSIIEEMNTQLLHQQELATS